MSSISTQNAIRDVILGITPVIVPTTTMSAQNNTGDVTITVGSTSRFTIGGLVFFNDTLGEEGIPVSAISGTQLTLDFTGMGYTGLKYVHTSGTTVYTNLWTEARVEVAKMLVLGDPVIQVFALDGQDQTKTLGGNAGETLTVRVQYHRSLQRHDDQLMDPNVWAGRQSDAARADIQAIKTALATHRKLNGAAIDLGYPKSADRPYITTQYHPLAQIGDTPQFVVTMNVLVQDQWYRITP